MKVHELMTRSVITCTPETELSHVARILWERDCGAVPVVNDANEVVGMITDRDMSIALGTRNEPASSLRARDVMSGVVYACSPEQDVSVAMQTMNCEQVRRLPVVDSRGTLRGILCLNDLVLSAQPDARGNGRALSYNDVMETLKAVSAHRSTKQEPKEQAIPPTALGY